MYTSNFELGHEVGNHKSVHKSDFTVPDTPRDLMDYKKSQIEKMAKSNFYLGTGEAPLTPI